MVLSIALVFGLIAAAIGILIGMTIFDTVENSITGPLGATTLSQTYNQSMVISHRATTSSISGVACGTPIGVFGDDAYPLLGRSNNNAQCYRGVFEWDITSIPDGSTITDVDFFMDILQAVVARPCDINSMELQPSLNLGQPQAMWDDVANGTSYLSSSSFCQSAGVTTVDLGASADSELQARLVDDWFGFGLKYDNEVRDVVNHFNQIRSERLIVTYELPVDAEQGAEEFQNAKDTAWTVLGIIPVALFFIVFAVFSSVGSRQ